MLTWWKPREKMRVMDGGADVVAVGATAKVSNEGARPQHVVEVSDRP